MTCLIYHLCFFNHEIYTLHTQTWLFLYVNRCDECFFRMTHCVDKQLLKARCVDGEASEILGKMETCLKTLGSAMDDIIAAAEMLGAAHQVLCVRTWAPSYLHHHQSLTCGYTVCVIYEYVSHEASSASVVDSNQLSLTLLSSTERVNHSGWKYF